MDIYKSYSFQDPFAAPTKTLDWLGSPWDTLFSNSYSFVEKCVESLARRLSPSTTLERKYNNRYTSEAAPFVEAWEAAVEGKEEVW